MKQHTRRNLRQRKGQTLVETALVLSAVLLPTTLGILQFGIVINASNTLTQIAREGGRYAAVHGTEANSDAAIRTYVKQVAAGTSIAPADLTDARIVISMNAGAPRASGNAINVVVTYPMTKKVFVGNFLASVVKLKQDYTAESTFVLE